MEQELDLVVFEDDKGNEITMEVIDYFFYEGQEYAMLADYKPECDDCESEDCEACGPEEVVIMKVMPVGEDEEEFLPVDEELSQTLIDLIESGAFDEEDDEFYEEEDDEEESGEEKE